MNLPITFFKGNFSSSEIFKVVRQKEQHGSIMEILYGFPLAPMVNSRSGKGGFKTWHMSMGLTAILQNKEGKKC